MHKEETYSPRHPPRRRRLQLRSADYALTEWGEASRTPIIFLHGWGDTGATFQFVADELADRHHVIAPDWRGFGRSSHNAEAYWFPDYLADLDTLIDRLDVDLPVRLVGHSMGANVAGLYAGAMPERVSHFVNVEGVGLRDTDPGAAPGRYRDWLMRMRTAPSFRRFESVDALAAYIRRRSPLLSASRAAFVAEQWGVEAEDGIRLLADPKHKWPNPVLYRRAEAEACWQAITARVLLVTGGNSEFAAADEAALHATEHLQIPDVGHMIHFEAPEALAAAVHRFVDL